MSAGGNRGNGGNRAAGAAAAAIVGGGVANQGPIDPNALPADLEAQERELSARAERLRAAEAELIERQKDLDAREEQLKAELAERGRALRTNDEAYAGPNGGYEFEVGPTPSAAKSYPTLKTIRVRAIDESEAKRYYCATVEDPRPTRQGRQVDPVAIDIGVRCIDPRRQRDLDRAYQVAAIRRKREAGHPLSEQEQSLLSSVELALP